MRRFAIAVAAVVGLSVSAFGDVVVDFSMPVTTSPTDSAPGVWYTDRFAPAVFQSSTLPGSPSTPALQLGVAASDFQGSTSFYRFQGRHYDTNLSGPFQAVSINMYVDPSWATNNTPVNAGFWTNDTTGGVYTGNNDIIDYLNDDTGDPHTGYTVPGFYTFDDAGDWSFLAAGTTGLNNLKVVLDPGVGETYFVDGVKVGTEADTSTDSFQGIILNATNFGTDQSYYFTDLVATSVPLPSTAWTFLTLIGSLAGFRVWKRSRAIPTFA